MAEWFRDEFTNSAVGTLIQSRSTTGGQVWAKHPGATRDYLISDQLRARKASAGNTGLYYADVVPPSDDVSVTTEIYIRGNDTGNSGPTARMDTVSQNFYFFTLDDNVNQYRLYRCDGGSFTELDNAPATILDETLYTLVFTVTGNHLEGYGDGVLVCEATDNTYTTGRAGFRGTGGGTNTTGEHINRYWVTSPDAGEDATGNITEQGVLSVGGSVSAFSGVQASASITAQPLNIVASSISATSQISATTDIQPCVITIAGGTITATSSEQVDGVVSSQSLSASGGSVSASYGQQSAASIAPGIIIVAGGVLSVRSGQIASGQVSSQILTITGGTVVSDSSTDAIGNISAHTLQVVGATLDASFTKEYIATISGQELDIDYALVPAQAGYTSIGSVDGIFLSLTGYRVVGEIITINGNIRGQLLASKHLSGQLSARKSLTGNLRAAAKLTGTLVYHQD